MWRLARGSDNGIRRVELVEFGIVFVVFVFVVFVLVLELVVVEFIILELLVQFFVDEFLLVVRVIVFVVWLVELERFIQLRLVDADPKRTPSRRRRPASRPAGVS